MSEELEKRKGGLEKQEPKKRGGMSRMEQQLRVYGSNIRDALTALTEASGAINIERNFGKASTYMRFAAHAISEPQRYQDSKRPKEEIVAEVCEIFGHGMEDGPLEGLYKVNKECVDEVVIRCRVTVAVAIDLVKEYAEGPEKPALPGHTTVQRAELES